MEAKYFPIQIEEKWSKVWADRELAKPESENFFSQIITVSSKSQGQTAFCKIIGLISFLLLKLLKNGLKQKIAYFCFTKKL